MSDSGDIGPIANRVRAALDARMDGVTVVAPPFDTLVARAQGQAPVPPSAAPLPLPTAAAGPGSSGPLGLPQPAASSAAGRGGNQGGGPPGPPSRDVSGTGAGGGGGGLPRWALVTGAVVVGVVAMFTVFAVVGGGDACAVEADDDDCVTIDGGTTRRTSSSSSSSSTSSSTSTSTSTSSSSSTSTTSTSTSTTSTSTSTTSTSTSTTSTSTSTTSTSTSTTSTSTSTTSTSTSTTSTSTVPDDVADEEVDAVALDCQLRSSDVFGETIAWSLHAAPSLDAAVLSTPRAPASVEPTQRLAADAADVSLFAEVSVADGGVGWVRVAGLTGRCLPSPRLGDLALEATIAMEGGGGFLVQAAPTPDSVSEAVEFPSGLPLVFTGNVVEGYAEVVVFDGERGDRDGVAGWVDLDAWAF